MILHGSGMKSSESSIAGLATIQVKVCGLTRPDEAAACAELGAAAVGCVFYDKSPRCVTPAAAQEIRRALPPQVACVGVFVDARFERILAVAVETGITAVQLHGNEPPELIERLRHEGLFVIKALFADREPGIERAPRYPASVILAECGRGPLPGGNAQVWDWSRAAAVGERHPLILAGGLTPDNAAQAFRAALPDALDVSSGVETAPGRKDLRKVAQFIAAVTDAGARRRIFP
ncbi:MAG: phosphoribosylanthranilate isomerase [Desulfobacterales bacterium]|jgi:phosphoribosylanthranilate isomerase|nr:phosphoribosylanthranilate isomerase [Desulfobacterales bacterium]